ncbi:MAG: cysteine--tRNA ligase [Minisyncoccia bacterium]
MLSEKFHSKDYNIFCPPAQAGYNEEVPLRLHNTFTGKLEVFKPIKSGEARLYHCGPTVYNWAHIGNLRSYVFADVLRRALEYSGLKVSQVINITDIGHLSSDADEGDDKMVKGLKREGLPLDLEGLKKLADKYEGAFKEDLKLLNIKTPQHFPRATNYLAEDIELIKLLEKRGFTYKLDDGIYFETSKLEDYGKLGRLTPESEAVARLEMRKKSSRDFVLWKLSRESHLGFESPWGRGFPGWHIECSAMSRKLLGQPFDIHTGGIDHIPIHHNNEIAQSEAAYETPLANFWLHNEFVTVSDSKMAKSEGNQIGLKTLKEKGFSPLAYRYLLLTAHYRTPINFSWEALEAAENAYRKLKEFMATVPADGEIEKKLQKEFLEAIEDDLNTPRALATLSKVINKSANLANAGATIIDFDRILGLNLKYDESRIPKEALELKKKRELARKGSNFKEADKIRQEIKKIGYDVIDYDSDKSSLLESA